MEQIGKIALRSPLSGRRVIPMPEWAFCDRCGLLRLHVPEVVAMVLERLDSDSTDGVVSRCKCEGAVHGPTVEDLERVSNLPHRWTFETFEDRPGTEFALRAAREFAAGTAHVVLTLFGPTGRGKSHLAESIAREAMARGVSARYEFVPALLRAMRKAGRDAVDAEMGRCLSAGVLVLDDLGLEKASSWTEEQLTSIVEERMGLGRRTVVTTNKTREDLMEKGYERLASRMWAVGSSEARVATFDGRVVSDYRVTGGGK